MSEIKKYLTLDKKIRVASVISTDIIKEICTKQNTMPLASIILGRALTGSILMSSQLDEGQSLALHFKGNGPLQEIYAEASYEGAVRGFVSKPAANVEPKNGVLKLGDGIGIGVLNVTKNSADFQGPVNGSVMILTGEIGDDIAYYLEQSDQIKSIVAVGVSLDQQGNVLKAGGLIIEIMQLVTEDEITELEKTLAKAKPLTELLEAGADEKAIVKNFLGDYSLEPIQHDYSYRYQCRCSQEKMISSIKLLGKSELESIIDNKKDIDVKCELCNHTYQITLNELKIMASDASYKVEES
jgi:molecular chaperone Hsp33